MELACPFDSLFVELVRGILHWLFPWDRLLFLGELRELFSLRLVSRRFCEAYVADIMASIEAFVLFDHHPLPCNALRRFTGMRCLVLDEWTEIDEFTLLALAPKLTRLTVCYITRQTTIMLASTMTVLTNLQTLTLSQENEADDPDLSFHWQRLPLSLTSLTIDRTGEPGWDLLESLPSSLRLLDCITYDGTGETILSHLSRLTSLTSLSFPLPVGTSQRVIASLVRFAPHGCVIDTEVVLQLTALEELDLRSNNHIPIGCLTQLSRLNALCVQHTEERRQFGPPESLDCLCTLTQLRRLSLECYVESRGILNELSSLCNMTHLSVSCLFGVRSSLPALTRLISLHLDGMGIVVNEFRALRHLSIGYSACVAGMPCGLETLLERDCAGRRFLPSPSVKRTGIRTLCPVNHVWEDVDIDRLLRSYPALTTFNIEREDRLTLHQLRQLRSCGVTPFVVHVAHDRPAILDELMWPDRFPCWDVTL